MESSKFSHYPSRFDAIEQIESQGATCDTFRVKLFGKLHFLKRLKSEYTGNILYQEALRKEFETGYCLEHPNLVRYISLDNDSILMEYVEGEALSQRLATNPVYFKNQKNTDKFISQLLDAIGYLHSHQVLHLDLKPDNILLSHIHDDVKLIDLGCCYTDSFPDTTGHTNSFAAPEQLSGRVVDIRTDIYAIGKILECLPDHTKYNKVIARCTAENPASRYQSVDEIQHDINHRRRTIHALTALVFVAVLFSVGVALLTRLQPQSQPTPALSEVQKDSMNHVLPKDTFQQTAPAPVINNPIQQPPKKDERAQLNEDIEQFINKAYHSTIATFCDSVFPPPIPSTDNAWADVSTEFHNQTLQIGDRLIKKYPAIPESTIRQEIESRFQSLVGYVFNQMRQNAQTH